MTVRSIAALLALIVSFTTLAADHPLSGIGLRNIGPALASGRIADFAIHPDKPQIMYVATASGGVWKTTDRGIGWTPIFDGENSFATGYVAIDPHDTNTVWVGTGENNAQRSVAYGDGVYKSTDGGKSWTNMGLKDSGHISMIRFHPTERNVVWVAAQGPLWNSGGDRGLYKSTDGGETWEAILTIDEDTGVNEFVIDPANPDTIVASSWQRRRHVWTLISGGPGGGIHKTTDGGKTWRKLSSGLPGGDVGRIGLASAPSAPHIIYAIVEADSSNRGTYRTTDFGESWEKRSSYVASSPQYYNELIVDPHNPDRVYSMSTFAAVSEDGGQSFNNLSIRNRHVDDHALWIDPANTDHLIIGGDGGIYESWDQGQSWRHFDNLPIVQFYRGTPDNDLPFYNVCAGTQDNHTPCGPSQNRYTDGITNADWWIAQFGDGFKPQFDPNDPTIVYAQYQYGGLVRFDRDTGERLYIVPHAGADENADRWNWNSPLIVSPHSPTRLYYGSQRLWRSDDRGNSWQTVSDDLSRQLDRNQLEVMGRVWGVDTIAKNASTSMYGSLIALAESPLVEGLLYVGTDDGLIRVSENGGDSWSRVDKFRGVPERSLVEDIIASEHDPDVAYAVFDNHKQGDYKPYVYMTSDRGRSWTNITGDLPERGTAHTLAQDHVDPNLLFVGTEFGVFFSVNGGQNWTEFGGLPTIAVRDLEIQRREGDLVVVTFGRGVYIVDDYSPLRTSVDDLNDNEATVFEVKDTWLFVPDDRRGWGPKGDYGDDRYSAANPAFGATVSYYLRDGFQSLADQRREAEKEKAEKGEDTPYPSWDALRAEDTELAPSVWLEVTDSEGNVVRRVEGNTGKGFHRTAWDLRYPAPDPVDLSPPPTSPAPWQSPSVGPMVVPGEYRVQLMARVRDEVKTLGEPKMFLVKPMFDGDMMAKDRRALLAFQNETARLYRAVTSADSKLSEIDDRIAHLRAAITDTPSATADHARTLRGIELQAGEIHLALDGDRTIARRYEATPMSINNRLGAIIFGHWGTQAEVPQTFRDSLAIAESQFADVMSKLTAVEASLSGLESQLAELGAPWTPGRMPVYR